MPHYVKKLWKKNYWHELRSIRVFVSKTVTVIFFRALARRGNWKVKLSALAERKETLSILHRKLAKWSKQRIDARNTWTRSDFCEGEWDNDLTYYLFLFWKIDNIKPIPAITSTIFQIVLPNAILKMGWNKIAKAT